MNPQRLILNTTPFLVAVALTLCSTSKLLSQSDANSDWQTETSQRLQSIFARGEWRPAPFEATWLPDSSGYQVRQRKKDSGESQQVIVDVVSGEVRDEEFPPRLDPMISPDGTARIEVRAGELFRIDQKSGESIRLSEENNSRGISLDDISWSPDGSHILFVETNSSKVRKRSVLVPTDPSFPGVRENLFARIGETIPSLRVGVVDREGLDLRWLPIEYPESGCYLGQVEWAGNNNEILVEMLSRFRDKRDYFLVDLQENKTKTIYTESSETWVTASQETDLRIIWIKNGEQFILLSEKDGWRHAYLHSRDDKLIALLTPGDFDIIDRGGVDETNGQFYFYASPNNGTQKYLFRCALDGSGKLERITPESQPGTHAYQFSPDYRWAIHTYSTFDNPPVVDLVSLPEHKSIRVLEDNSQLKETANHWITQKTEFFAIDIGAGISVDAWMMKPKDFDETKKYPVFVYVYGEPHAQTVLDSWGAAQSPFLRTIADLGYLVVSIDNRGTPCPKGAAWRRSIFGSLGPLSTEEQAKALQKLGEMKSYVDLSRVGIWGWSGGGSNTLNALFRKPDVYHVGIAVVPKPQPHLYNAWFQEIYMRTPAVNPEGYERSAPINFAEGLKGKLLIITGSGETNTHIQIIEGLVDKLIELGKPFDYMVYPNRDHGLREGTGTEVHVRMLIARYLVNNLPRGPK